MPGLKGHDRTPGEDVRIRRNSQRLASTFTQMLGDGFEVDADGLLAIDVQDPIFVDGSGVGLQYGTGLALSGTNLALSHLGLEALTDPGMDRIFFWDESANAAKWLGPGTGLLIDGVSMGVDTTVFVPYVGASADVNLGEHSLILGVSTLSVIGGFLTDTGSNGFESAAFVADRFSAASDLTKFLYWDDDNNHWDLVGRINALGVNSLTAGGTVQAEQLTSTDDAFVTAILTVGGSITDGTRTLTMGVEPWALSHDFKVDKAAGFAHMEVIGNDNGASMAVETKAPTNNKYCYYLFKEDGVNKYGWIYYQGNGDYYVYDYANSKIMLYYDQSDPELELMASAHGNIACFPRTDVGDAADGKRFRIWRKAAEGDNNIDFYIDNARIGKIATDVARLDIATVLKPTGYQSSDGSAGITQSETGVTNFDIVIKNGLITSFTKN